MIGKSKNMYFKIGIVAVKETMQTLILLVALSLCLSMSALAIDNQGNYAVWGMGKTSCFKYGQASTKEELQRYKDYSKGFLTAYNIFTENTYSISGKMKLGGIFEWVDIYCGENPMSSFHDALTEFTLEHHDIRIQSSGSQKGR